MRLRATRQLITDGLCKCAAPATAKDGGYKRPIGTRLAGFCQSGFVGSVFDGRQPAHSPGLWVPSLQTRLHLTCHQMFYISSPSRISFPCDAQSELLSRKKAALINRVLSDDANSYPICKLFNIRDTQRASPSPSTQH